MKNLQWTWVGQRDQVQNPDFVPHVSFSQKHISIPMILICNNKGHLLIYNEKLLSQKLAIRSLHDGCFLYLGVYYVLFRSSRDWMMPIHIVEGNLLNSAYQFKCYSLLETPSETHPEIMFNQICGQLIIQSS